MNNKYGQPLVELFSVSKDYTHQLNRVHALKDVSLKISHGEFLALYGPSGSGKSTLCNLIGLIDKPSNGSMYFDGLDISLCNDYCISALRREHLGFVFQNFNLIPVLNALENILLPLRFRGKLNCYMVDEAKSLMNKIGLRNEMFRTPNELSGGQQQRVAIARAIITNPSLIIADEPTANLDTKTSISLIDLMQEMNDTRGTTFLFSTHDGRLIERSKRKLQLEDGNIIEDRLMS